MERFMFLLIICLVPIVNAENKDRTPDGFSLQMLASKIEKMEMEMFDIKNENQKLGTKVEQFSLEKREIKFEVKSLRQHLEQLQRKILNLQNNNITFSAFTAYPSETRSYVLGQHVMFDVTLKNYNSAYNTEFSAFECPVSGYYMFYINLFTNPGLGLGACVVVDGISTQPDARSTTADYDTGSSFTVVHCDSGSLVWVEVTYVNNGELLGNTVSHFSGAFLYADLMSWY